MFPPTLKCSVIVTNNPGENLIITEVTGSRAQEVTQEVTLSMPQWHQAPRGIFLLAE